MCRIGGEQKKTMVVRSQPCAKNIIYLKGDSQFILLCKVKALDIKTRIFLII